MLLYQYPFDDWLIDWYDPLSIYYYKKSLKTYLKGVNSKEKKTVLEKLMLGLPMYGYRDYDAITGDGLVNLLKRFTVSIEYHENSQDHFMRFDLIW